MSGNAASTESVSTKTYTFGTDIQFLIVTLPRQF